MNRPSSRRGFLRGLSTLPLVGGGMASLGMGNVDASPASEGSPDDAELLRLGLQFEELRQQYEKAEAEVEQTESTDARLPSLDDNADDLAVRMQPVMHSIARLNASTPAGMRVKLLAWEHCQYATGDDIDELIEAECTNERLRLSILRDLLAQHGIELRQLDPPSDATA